MSRLLIVLRVLIFVGALASVMNVRATSPSYRLTAASWSPDSGGNSAPLPVDGRQLVKVVLTAVSLSLL